MKRYRYLFILLLFVACPLLANESDVGSDDEYDISQLSRTQISRLLRKRDRSPQRLTQDDEAWLEVIDGNAIDVIEDDEHEDVSCISQNKVCLAMGSAGIIGFAFFGLSRFLG